MRPSTRRQLTFAAALLGGLFLLGAGTLYVLYLRVPFVHKEVDSLFPRHRGEVVATVGISLDEMRRRSSAPIRGYTDSTGATGGAFEPFFDFQVLGTSLHFRGCRYGSYHTDKSGMILWLTVFTSPRRVRWSEMAEELRATGDQLNGAGFLPADPGHREMRDDLLLAEWVTRKKPPTADFESTDPFTWRRGDLEIVFYAEQQETGRWVLRVNLGRTKTPG